MRKPERAVLTIWRIVLVLIALVPAFLVSLFFAVGGRWWTLFTVLWVAAFLFFYLFYLPLRFRNLTFHMLQDSIEVHSGVFYKRVRFMPLNSIQYAGLVISPLSLGFGLATLVVTAAGGRLSFPGLARKDAEVVAKMLPGGKRAGPH